MMLQQHYCALKAGKIDSLETLPTVIMQQKLDKKTWLNWAEFNSNSENVPLCLEFLKFIDLHVGYLENVSYQTQTSLGI